MAELTGIEVFEVGTHTDSSGREAVFDDSTIDRIIANFRELEPTFSPPLKLGHSESQALAKILAGESGKAEDLPSLGWISNVYREGKKLLVDLANIPDRVLKLMKERRYRHRSVEIARSLTAGGKEYKDVLIGLALLGMERPALMSLKHAFRASIDIENCEILTFTMSARQEAATETHSKEDDSMGDKTNEASEKEVRTFNEAEAQRLIDAAVTKAKAEVTAAITAQHKGELERRDRVASFQAAVSAPDSDGRVLPAAVLSVPGMKNLVNILAGANTYKFSAADGKEIEEHPLTTLQNALSQAAKSGVVKLGEHVRETGDNAQTAPKDFNGIHQALAAKFMADQKKAGAEVKMSDALEATYVLADRAYRGGV